MLLIKFNKINAEQVREVKINRNACNEVPYQYLTTFLCTFKGITSFSYIYAFKLLYNYNCNENYQQINPCKLGVLHS